MTSVRQIQPPDSFDAASLAAWHYRLKNMRSNCQNTISYDASIYAVEDLKWTQTAYISPQMRECWHELRVVSLFHDDIVV